MAPSLFTSLLLLVPQLLGAVALPQHSHTDSTSTNKHRADAVKEAFDFAWHGYYNYAFPDDELHPVSKTGGNSRNGWGASAVDALSTALIMGNRKVVNQILDYIPTIDFTRTATTVSLFETTIRYLGGMISGYDLLKGPLAHLADNDTNVDALLHQAKVLADSLKYAFDTPSGVPYNNLIFNNSGNDGATTNGLATAGSLVLEWTRLSDLLHDNEYARLAQKAEAYLLYPRPAYNEPWPGLVGGHVSIATGDFVDATGGWTGGTDSFYEYLIKMWIYDPNRFSTYKDRWTAAIDSSIAHLASHPASRPDLTYLARYTNRTLIPSSQHLACFDGGNFILGGAALHRQDYIDFGLALTAGCRNTYASTATGIGPEVFNWGSKSIPTAQYDFYVAHGFWIKDGTYDLRPETLESYYHAWRYTRDPVYREWAWEGFVAINATARRGVGFSSISDVDAEGGGDAMDNQESFLFAEVLKYAYLVFAEEAEYQVFGGVGAANGWVYNTEAHPFRVYGGSG